MPEDVERNTMTKLMNGVLYKSPEACDQYWNIVHSYVSVTFVDSNSDWQSNMRKAYHEGINKYADQYWV